MRKGLQMAMGTEGHKPQHPLILCEQCGREIPEKGYGIYLPAQEIVVCCQEIDSGTGDRVTQLPIGRFCLDEYIESCHQEGQGHIPSTQVDYNGLVMLYQEGKLKQPDITALLHSLK